MTTKVAKRVRCPECGYRVEMPVRARLGTRVECDECGELLEVINLDPLELDFAEWDDDWDDDEDDY